MTTLSKIYERCDEVEERLDFPAGGQAVVLSARSPDKESANEDSAAIIDAGNGAIVLAVADGLGGQPGGDQASAIAVRELRNCVHAARKEPTSVREAILDGFDRANRAIIGQGNGSATTLVVVEVDERHARSYHVGDSGLLVCGGRGKIKLETIAHSPVGYAVEAGILSAKEAIQHEDRHIVSNVVGDPSMHVGMSSPLRLRPRDTVVLASDGLFDNFHAWEIVEFVRRGSLSDGVHTLASRCRERMTRPSDTRPSKPDDLTIVAFRRPRTASKASS
ncbi:MAG: PP2C family serine/threonine-protein phosphatase [Gammaproteobacteria bacterium]|nr:PP2C family serine/threonine-protein phosphatase [Gammaproteobacteria bacterium]